MLSSEHLHLALNHFPILGLPVAALATGWGAARKNRETLRAGLALMVLCAAFTPLVMSTGQGAADAYDGVDFVDSDGYAWMTAHGERATKAAIAAYAAGGLALAGFLASFFADKMARLAGLTAILAAFIASGLAVWTADAGGKIRRPDFREKTATSLSPKTTTESP